MAAHVGRIKDQCRASQRKAHSGDKLPADIIKAGAFVITLNRLADATLLAYKVRLLAKTCCKPRFRTSQAPCPDVTMY